MKGKIFERILVLLLALPLVTLSCGGGGGGGNDAGAGGAGPKAVVSTGTMTKGSVIVNGVRFNAAGASITIDDNPGAEAGLHDGMQVHVKGQINDDGVTGTAELVEAEDSLQGVVSAKDTLADPPTLTVLAHKVIVDDLTVFANGASLAAINPGDVVEVHGQEDVNGVHATRIEAGVPNEAEMKGTISGLAGDTFSVGGQQVNFAGATIDPAGTALKDGDFVEVEGGLDAGGVLVATKVELEDIEDVEFEPAENEEAEVEGLVIGFAGGDTFKVGAVDVDASGADFKGGSSIDLANGVAVEAEGNMVGGVIQAREIKFKRDAVRMITDDMTMDLANRKITMMGKDVKIDDLTEIDADVAGALRVEVRGFVDKSGTIIADEVRNAGNSQGGDDVLQSGVEAETGTSLTIMGINCNMAGAGMMGDDDAAVSSQAFFSTVTPAATGGTIVKVRGKFDPATNSMAITEAEIED
ncbi:MAG: hypothetical protein HZA16_08085 [Nitrospirae bacterium]|nr:hypothetical protein [Nitrospirota bacterium]